MSASARFQFSHFPTLVPAGLAVLLGLPALRRVLKSKDPARALGAARVLQFFKALGTSPGTNASPSEHAPADGNGHLLDVLGNLVYC